MYMYIHFYHVKSYYKRHDECVYYIYTGTMYNIHVGREPNILSECNNYLVRHFFLVNKLKPRPRLGFCMSSWFQSYTISIAGISWHPHRQYCWHLVTSTQTVLLASISSHPHRQYCWHLFRDIHTDSIAGIYLVTSTQTVLLASISWHPHRQYCWHLSRDIHTDSIAGIYLVTSTQTDLSPLVPMCHC